jgi:hypothetical protein
MEFPFGVAAVGKLPFLLIASNPCAGTRIGCRSPQNLLRHVAFLLLDCDQQRAITTERHFTLTTAK